MSLNQQHKHPLRKLWKDFIQDERGQSTTEYILILAVVVMVAMKFKKEFEGRLGNIIGSLGGQIEGALEPTD